MTNGDKIRSMSDEELSRIEHFCPYDHECIHLVSHTGDYRCTSDGVTCDECKLEWLREEAETTKNKLKKMTLEESFVLAAALRYALPRRTYALSIVAGEIIRAIPRMTAEQRKSYIGELCDVQAVDFIAAEEIERLRQALAFGGGLENGEVCASTAETSKESLRTEN